MNTRRCRSGSRCTAATSWSRHSRANSWASGDRSAGPRRALDRVLIAASRIGDRKHPARAARARLLPIEAAVNQNARQPDFERQVALERRDVRVRLHEGILHRFVGVGHIAQIVPGDPRRAALLAGRRSARTDRGRRGRCRRRCGPAPGRPASTRRQRANGALRGERIVTAALPLQEPEGLSHAAVI